MAEQLLHCAGCNASFKAKTYDPNRAYPCPKCKQPLKVKGEADASASGVTLDTRGKAAQTDEGKDPLVGQKIAQYQIEKKLGQGGMGSVYKAKHLELGRSVALKILSPRLAEEEPDAVERFKREARAAAVLEHPNVVTTHAVGSEGNHHFIELQLVDGESLQARVVREKRLSLAEATRIILDSSKALAVAHKQNIVHRDIKPGNIMLTKDGQVKVMDFGLAKDVTAPTQLTVSGHIMGTPHYMSPEQCDAKPLDGRSDIYALGATYFAILSGKTPYQGESLLSILQQQVTAPVPDVRKECPDLPEVVQHVLEKAMAKKPEDRFQTMEEFGAALARVQGAGSGAAAPAAPATVKTPAATEAETLAATLGDVMDEDEERESHLHTARIRGRIKEVEAFLGAWKDLAKAAAASRKKGQASEAEEAEFAKLRTTIHKQYAGILRRLGNPGAPGQRVVSACETGVTLSSIVQMADADFRDLSSHFQTGAKLLFDYVAFLEEGRQDLLKQSTFYFYWDKVMHNPMAAAIAGMAALMLLSIIGWQVVTRLPKGKLTPRKDVVQEAATTEDETSDGAPAETVAPAKTTAPPEPVATDAPAPQIGGYQLWKRFGPAVSVPGPDGKTRQLPAGDIRAVKYCPDGKHLAVAHPFGIDLYETETYTIVRRMDGHENTVNAIDFTADGGKMASCSADGPIRVWDVASGREIQSLKYSDYVTTVAISPDGRCVASHAWDSTVRLWNVETGKARKLIDEGHMAACPIAFSADGARLLTGSPDKTVRLWDVATGKRLCTAKGHAGSPRAVAFHPNGRMVASAVGTDVRLWDATTGAERKRLRSGATVGSLAFCPEGRRLAVGGYKRVQVWDLDSGATPWRVQTHNNFVYSVSFSLDGQRLVSGSRNDEAIRIWDVAKGAELRCLNIHEGLILTAALSPNGRCLAWAGPDTVLRLWDLETATLRPLPREVSGVRVLHRALTVSPDGRHVAWGHCDNTFRLWDGQADTKPTTLEGQTSPVFSAAFGAEGRRLVSGDADKVIRLWDVETGKALRTFGGPKLPVLLVALSPDGKKIASRAHWDGGQIRLWEVSTGRDLSAPKGAISAAFGPQGRRIAFGFARGPLRILDAETQRELLALETPYSYSVSPAFSPDGRFLACGYYGRPVLLWDLETGEQVQTLEGHRDSVESVTFMKNGEFLASHSRDGTICLWRRAAGGRAPVDSTESGILAERPAYPGFFPIGVWSIWFGSGSTQEQIQAKTERAREVLQQMKTFGINTPFSTNLYAGDDEPRLAMLAKELGMHLISYNTRLRKVYESKKPVNVSEVQKIVAEDARRLKECPNLFEYFVWADPPQPHFRPDMWKTMAQACMETDPTHPPQFIYNDAQAARPYWEASLLPSIHHYIHPFRAETPSAEAINTQIKHLRSFSQLAPDASRIAWIQAFGDGKRHRAPSATEMRCLASLALGHGAKGLVYYAWGSTKYDALVTRDGQPTERAHEAKRLGQVIEKIGPVLLRVRLASDLAQAKGNALATTLVSKNGLQYAFVVNLDVEKPAQIKVAVTPTAGKALAGVRDVLAGKAVEAGVAAAKLTFTARLEPGEGRLFRILHGAGAAPGRSSADFVVRQDGTGDFTDLTEAIDVAKRGQTIEIADSGRYAISGTHIVSSTLRGAPRRRPTIAFAHKKATLTFQPGSRLENVTVEGETSVYTHGAAFENVRFASAMGVAFCTNPGFRGKQTLSIRNCLFTVRSTLLGCAGPSQNLPLKIVFEHNTVAGGGSFYVTGQTVTIEARENVFAGMNRLVSCVPRPGKPEGGCGKCTFIGARNCYHQVGTFMVSRGTVAAEKFEVRGFKAWQARTGTDTDSFEADPKFVNRRRGDFRLAADSPCRDKGADGTNLGVQWDRFASGATGPPAVQPKPTSDKPQALVVKQDGTGASTDLAKAIKAAKPGQIIEIADSGRYTIPRGGWDVPGAVVGAPGQRPTIAIGERTALSFSAEGRLENVVVDGVGQVFTWGGTFQNVQFANDNGIILTISPRRLKAQSITIQNCLFTGKRRALFGAGPTRGAPTRVLFEHNTVANVGLPFQVGGQTLLIEARRNIFAGVDALVLCEHLPSNPQAGCGKCTFVGARNCYYGVRKYMISRGAAADEKFEVNSFKEWQAKTGADTDSFEADPKFVDAKAGDFRLAPDSPCRGKGPGGTDIGIQWAERKAETLDAAAHPESYTNRVDGSKMVLVRGGTFRMGSGRKNESPVHDVRVDSFYLSKCEITNRQFKKFVDANPEWQKGKPTAERANPNYLKHWPGDSYPAGQADHPVAWVSWFAAKAYCEWAGGRLPTEAEWEYACRAGSTGKYCFGDEGSKLKDYAWYADNSGGSTHPVGQRKASDWGLHDMHGNVLEWTSTIHRAYPYRGDDGREDARDARSIRTMRGGEWKSRNHRCRSAARTASTLPGCLDGFGFRMAMSASEVQKADEAPAAPSATDTAPAATGVRLPSVISDHMVLQRDMKVPIWGWASAGGKVTVSFAGQTKTATAGQAGKWRVTLDPLSAGGPHQMTVAGGKTLTVRDVLVGDVWVCSGQSNMAWNVSGCLNANQEIAAANLPKIRLASVGSTPFSEPQSDCQVSWELCSPRTVGRFSGAAYYFGRELHRTLNVPVGLIQASQGSTQIKTWTSRSALMRLDYGRRVVKEWDRLVASYDAEAAQRRYQAALAKWEQAKAAGAGKRRARRPQAPVAPDRDRFAPTTLYNGMIAPLMPFGIRGAIWYQGESDARPPNCYEYRNLLPAMIGAWRAGWGQGDFPFLCVQIANYSGSYGSGWEVVREAELLACRLSSVAMAVAIDNAESGEVHPENKQEIGRRLALAARHVAYGEDVVYSGPIYRSMQAQGSKIELTFDHVHAGLTAKGGKLAAFEIAGGDRQFLPAQAEIRGDKIVVWHDQIAKPAAVRYGWDKNPPCNLYNRDGLPASPFRTDDWPVLGHPDYGEDGQ